MNKAQIKAELRRSACEDESTFFGVHILAFKYALKAKDNCKELLSDLSDEDCRTFFLLVAEAL